MGLVRRRNEDAFHVSTERGLAVVADGMGGAPAGQLASRLAVEAAVEALTGEPAGDALTRLDASVQAAATAVVAEGERNPHNRGLGCTLTVLQVDPEHRRYGLAHVGDSRAYRLRDGALELLSVDHTLAQESVDQGRLPPDAVRHHPFGHILTRVIGMEGEVEAQTAQGSLEAGDLFLLCTDGLVKVMEDEEIADVLRLPWDDLEVLAERLVAEANDRGGPDNSTVVLLHHL